MLSPCQRAWADGFNIDLQSDYEPRVRDSVIVINNFILFCAGQGGMGWTIESCNWVKEAVSPRTKSSVGV